MEPLTRSMSELDLFSGPLQVEMPSHQAHTTYGGAGGYRTRTSIGYPAYHVSGGSRGYRTRIPTSSIGGRISSGLGAYQASSNAHGSSQIGDENAIMNQLNERLASYMETVRNLEQANEKLEIEIRKVNARHSEECDHTKYESIIHDLWDKILERKKENGQLAIHLDNGRLALEDFKLKVEYEASMRQAIEADVNRLRRTLDDTNVINLHLEADIECLTEEKITLKKNHEEEMQELRDQSHTKSHTKSHTVQVDDDAPKGQDLAKIMEGMREKYEKIFLQNKRESQELYESQVKERQVQVTENTAALKEATTMVTETRRKVQNLDIVLQSELSQNELQGAKLRDTDMHYNREMERYNSIILTLQAELTQICTHMHQCMQDYEVLEAKITEYRRRLGGGDYKLEDALHSSKTIQTKVEMSPLQSETIQTKTNITTLEDGKVVSEDVKTSEQVLLE